MDGVISREDPALAAVRGRLERIEAWEEERNQHEAQMRLNVAIQCFASRSLAATLKIGGMYSKTAAKVIPFVSLGVGFCLGGCRIWSWWKTGDRSEIAKAIGEVASGGIACVPGGGLFASGVIDICLATTDIAQSIHESKDVITVKNCDIQTAYSTLGLTVAPGGPLPTQEEVDVNYKKMICLLHSDIIAGYPPHIKERMDDYTRVTNVCRDVIYAERGWR